MRKASKKRENQAVAAGGADDAVMAFTDDDVADADAAEKARASASDTDGGASPTKAMTKKEKKAEKARKKAEEKERKKREKEEKKRLKEEKKKAKKAGKGGKGVPNAATDSELDDDDPSKPPVYGNEGKNRSAAAADHDGGGDGDDELDLEDDESLDEAIRNFAIKAD